MAAIEIPWNPTNRQLRQFAALSLVALPILGWLFSGKPGVSNWTSGNSLVIGGLGACGVLIALAGWLRPQWLRPLFLSATLVAFPIGLVLAEVILLAIYGLVFVPFALAFRFIGRDVLDRRVDRQTASYWQRKAPPSDAASYYRQS
jgi:hypothetical protein